MSVFNYEAMIVVPEISWFTEQNRTSTFTLVHALQKLIFDHKYLALSLLQAIVRFSKINCSNC